MANLKLEFEEEKSKILKMFMNPLGKNTSANKKGFIVPAGHMMKPRLYGTFGSLYGCSMGFSAKRAG
jgi:hypothetical protein